MTAVWTIYLIELAGHLSWAARLVLFFSVIVFAILTISKIVISHSNSMFENDKCPSEYKTRDHAAREATLPMVNRAWKCALVALLVAAPLMVAVPSKATLIAMFSAHYVASIDDVGELPVKSVRALNKMLDGYLAEQPPETD